MTARARQLAAWQEYRASVAAFQAQRAADQQARINALMLEVVAALAELVDAPSSLLCPDCHHALAPRVRTCPHCRDVAAMPLECAA